MVKKQASMKFLFVIMGVSLLVASLWDKVPQIKNAIHYALNPTAGFLISWNLAVGMLLVILVINILTTIIQKYTTDQKTLKEMKKEQKDLQNQMKEARQKGDTQKMSELSKKQFGFMGKQFKLNMNSLAYTSIPLILLFRWFNDYFVSAGNPKFFGFMGWFIFYLIASIILSGILKKVFDVA